MTEMFPQSPVSLSRPRLWLADSIGDRVLSRLRDLNSEVKRSGVRPRLVIFDYLESPVAGTLRTMASDLGVMVGLEPIEQSLPASALRDRFRLLEKSRGVHGVLFPTALSEAHRSCLEAHPELRHLDLDSRREGFSPQATAFLQLAAAFGWDPRGRRTTLLAKPETAFLCAGLAEELAKTGMSVEVVQTTPSLQAPPLGHSDCVWFCHGRQMNLAQLHLGSGTVIVDVGRAFDLAASLTPAQNRHLACRSRGLCPADGGLSALVMLHRLQRVLRRALGPSRISESERARGRSSAFSPRGVRL